MVGEIRKNVIVEFEARHKGLKEVAQELYRASNTIKLVADRWNISATSLKGAMNTNMASQRLDAVKETLDRTRLSAEQLNHALKKLGWSFNKEGILVNAFGEPIEGIGKAAELSKKSLNKLKKASIRRPELLSIMFAAMAANRALTNMWRGMVTSFQRANEDTEGLGKSTWHLQAAWEFFKYSLIDALTSSGVFKTFIDWLLKAVNWLNSLSDGEKSFIAISTAVGLVTTAIITMLAQLGLAKEGLKMLGWGGADKTLGEIGAVNEGLTSMQKLARIGIGVVLVWQGINIMREGVLEGEIWKEFVGLLGTTLGGAIIGSAFGPVGAAVGAVIGLTIGLILNMVWSWDKQKIANDINSDLKEIGMIVEEQPQWGTKIGLDIVPGTLPKKELEDMRANLKAMKDMDWQKVLKEYAEEGDRATVTLSKMNISARDYVDLTPNLKGLTDDATKSMWDYSSAVSAVNIGNSPTGLIHIIDSENQIINLQPLFDLAIKSMTDELNEMSEALDNQTNHLRKVISALSDYIKKLQEAQAQEKKSKSGGILGAISSVIGSRATGGYISRTGPYMLHEGEFVVPRGAPGNQYQGGDEIQNNYSISLSVYADTTDPDEMGRIILDKISNELNRVTDVNNT